MGIAAFLETAHPDAQGRAVVPLCKASGKSFIDAGCAADVDMHNPSDTMSAGRKRLGK